MRADLKARAGTNPPDEGEESSKLQSRLTSEMSMMLWRMA